MSDLERDYIVDAQAQHQGVSVTVTIRVEKPERHPDRGELGEVAGATATRLLGQTVDAIGRNTTVPF